MVRCCVFEMAGVRCGTLYSPFRVLENRCFITGLGGHHSRLGL
jgi:hypothetical protein